MRNKHIQNFAKTKINTIIIGNGEVGSALYGILKKRKEKKSIKVIDSKDTDFDKEFNLFECDVLHIAIPFIDSNSFNKVCLSYIRVMKPKLVIIHSTVKVGTTKRIQHNATKISKTEIFVVHSPVRGIHPYLEKSLKLFVKYIGTTNRKAYNLAKNELSNMKVEWINNPDATELGKLLDTSYYGLCIAWHREMKDICNHFSVDFNDAVTKMNISYNKSYAILKKNVVRPVLLPPEGQIGGHCVVPNAKILNRQKRSKFLKLIQ